MKFYKCLLTGSIYKTENTVFSDGTPTVKVLRWNWCLDNWHGYISDHNKTRAEINKGVSIVEITEKQANKIILDTN